MRSTPLGAPVHGAPHSALAKKSPCFARLKARLEVVDRDEEAPPASAACTPVVTTETDRQVQEANLTQSPMREDADDRVRVEISRRAQHADAAEL